MSKIIKFSFYLCLIFAFSTCLSSCNSEEDINNKNRKVMINNVNYSSLTEAVNNAKNNDIIKIYDDIKDDKNILITRPITIKGISKNNQTKPKIYGSFTINLSGETDSLTIDNIELIHSGKNAPGENNNNSIGINLIDGGLTLKSSIIALSSPSEADKNAAGLILSRQYKSINTSPITILGNSFESYFINGEDLSAAMKILSNKPNMLKTLKINEQEIFNKNNFSTEKLSNQLVSIDYSSKEAKYNYYATTSLNDLMFALNNHQNSSNSIYILYAKEDQSLSKNINECYLNETTTLYIYGDANLDFNNITLNLEGFIESTANLKNLNILKKSSTANFVDKSKQKQN